MTAEGGERGDFAERKLSEELRSVADEKGQPESKVAGEKKEFISYSTDFGHPSWSPNIISERNSPATRASDSFHKNARGNKKETRLT